MDGFNDGMPERTITGFSLGTPVGFMLDSDKGVVLGCNDSGILGSSLGYSHGIELGIDEELSLVLHMFPLMVLMKDMCWVSLVVF